MKLGDRFRQLLRSHKYSLVYHYLGGKSVKPIIVTILTIFIGY